MLNEVVRESSLIDRLLTDPPTVTYVLGPAGAGKTSLLYGIAQRLASEQLKKSKQAALPLVVSVRSWNAETESVPNALARFARVPVALIDQWSEDQGILLLVDGLDELPAKEARAALAKIQQYLEGNPKNRLMLTCREDFALEPVGRPSLAIRIEPLSPNEADDYLRRLLVANGVEARLPWSPIGRTPAALQLEARLIMDQLSGRLTEDVRELAVDAVLEGLRAGGQASAGRELGELFRSLPEEPRLSVARALIARLGEQQAPSQVAALVLEELDRAQPSAAFESTHDLSEDERRVIAVLETDLGQDMAEIGSKSRLPPSRVQAALRSLVHNALVVGLMRPNEPPRYMLSFPTTQQRGTA